MDSHAVSEPADALRALAGQIRSEGSVISPLVVDPHVEPLIGELAAAGPATRSRAGEYALVLEAIREGYLLHYGKPRIIDADADRELALLAGDYLYALGLERLTRLGDLHAVRQLSDLIASLARIQAEDRPATLAEALWISTAVAIAIGEPEQPEPMAGPWWPAERDPAPRILAAARDRARAADPGRRLEAALERAAG